MRGKLWFIGGLATGFVLGARAGREKYEELVVKGRKVLDHPTVQEATGVAQAQANRLYAEGKTRLSHSKLGEKLSTQNGGTGAELGSTPNAYAGSTAGGAGTSGTTSSSSTSPTSAIKGKGSGAANGTSL